MLDAIGSRTMWVGEAGAGTRLKLAANAWVLTVVEGIAESLALTRGLGLDPALFLDAVGAAPLDAPYVQLKGEAMLDGALRRRPSASTARAQGRRADPRGRRGAGARPRRAARPCSEHFARAVEAGHGDQDMAATFLEH